VDMATEGIQITLSQDMEFSPSVQLSFLALLLSDIRFQPFLLKPEYFSDPMLRALILAAAEYRTRYHTCPGQDGFKAYLAEFLRPEDPQEAYPEEVLIQALQMLQEIPKFTEGDFPYLRERALQFVRTQRLRVALARKDQFLATNRHQEFAKLVHEAVSVGSEQRIHTLSQWDVDGWFKEAKQHRENLMPTGFPTLDQYIGGYGAGELITVVSTPSGGKTRYLLSMGEAAMRAGKDALFISVELENWKLCLRIAMRVMGVGRDQVLLDAAATKAIHEEARERYNGATINFARFQPGISTLGAIKAWYESEYLQEHPEPGIILLDYADVLAVDSRRENNRLELGDIYLGLFNWAIESRIPVGTASQTSMEGFDRRLLTMRNASETIKKAAVSDIVLTLNKDPENPFHHIVYVAKNRDGSDNHQVHLTINPETQSLHE
jgi:hypothetical protein